MGMASSDKKRFVNSAAQKKRFNLRKRKPDMRMTAILECTLRRVSSEMVAHCGDFQTTKRLKREEDTGSSLEVKSEEFARRWEKTQTESNFKDSLTDQNSIKKELPTSQATGPATVGPKSELQDQLDFETFMQSLSDFSGAEIEDLDDLLQELDFDAERTTMTAAQSCREVKEEVEDFLDNFDPFFPGILDILCF